jgi:hypothetical protein
MENGCLWAKPGGHKTSLRNWFRRKEGGGTEFVTFDPEPYSMEGMEAPGSEKRDLHRIERAAAALQLTQYQRKIETGLCDPQHQRRCTLPGQATGCGAI